MITLNIFSMNEFLNEVNRCKGPVRLYSSDGKIMNIKQNSSAQEDLQQMHNAGGCRSRLQLEIPEKSDYMNIIFFSLGDC